MMKYNVRFYFIESLNKMKQEYPLCVFQPQSKTPAQLAYMDILLSGTTRLEIYVNKIKTDHLWS